jgi:hypothetical protein
MIVVGGIDKGARGREGVVHKPLESYGTPRLTEAASPANAIGGPKRTADLYLKSISSALIRPCGGGAAPPRCQ